MNWQEFLSRKFLLVATLEAAGIVAFFWILVQTGKAEWTGITAFSAAVLVPYIMGNVAEKKVLNGGSNGVGMAGK